MRWVAAAAVALVVLGAGAAVLGPRAWNHYRLTRTVEPTTALGDQCDEVPDGAERITLEAADGQVLGAALVGPADATIGVVLRHGASQQICEWLPWAGRVAEATGARVLLFDRRGRGSSPGGGNLAAEPSDTVLAVDRLRETGVDRVALVASSMGNSIMFAAVEQVHPAPCALVSISPVLVSGDGSGTVDGRSWDGLVNEVWVTWEEQNAAIVSNATLILDRAATLGVVDPHALGVATSDHSRQLILNHPEAAAFVTDAIASCA